MNGRQERRAAGIHRVPVQALVELCGLDPKTAPAFEAEGVDVSGRGLHVRTAYLPDVGTPLVCRLEDRGREIIAEGVVAWASTDTGGGEFGLRFTALDQGSVAVLRELTGLGTADEAEDNEPDEPEVEAAGEPSAPAPKTAVSPATPAAVLRNEPGARVRLHIDGLGAPMKALVRSGSRSRVKVGSTLEMLRVGRRLEIENLEQSARRAACIDAVEVMLDPQTGVPQLVVALHYDDVADVTPDPTVIDDEAELAAVATEASLSRAAPPAARPGARPAAPSAPEIEVGAASDEDDVEAGFYDDDSIPPEDEVAEEAGRFQGRATVVAQRAGELARQTGDVLARWSGKAAVEIARLARDARGRVAEARGAGSKASKPRRTTAVPSSGVLASDGRRLRPQHARTASAEATEPAPPSPRPSLGARVLRSKPVRRVAIGAGLLTVATALGAYATRGGNAGLAAEAEAEASSARVAAVASVADVTEVDAEGNPRPAPTTPAKLATHPARSPDGIVADVPLFGPTPMATTEPAPLGPAPGTEAAEAEEVPAAKVAVADETFEEPVKKGADTWGRGRVNLPTIHRLRLDHAGTEIQGAPSATGFAVVLPGVKVMESGTGIAKRDDRIVRVSVENTAAGAKVTFRFRSDVPPYRVRLRKDFVEFLISAPK
jgi:hypothetical protein